MNVTETLNFSGQVALITGGSRGIGRAITLAFARLGATAIFCYQRDHAAATAVSQAAADHGWTVEAFCTDVSQRPAVDTLIAAVVTKHGRIDILVNNAGRFPQTPVLAMSDEEWDSVLRTNLYAAFYCARAVLPAMIAAQAGVIINMASIAGQRGSANHAHYAAAKGGLLAFTRSLAREVIQYNIRVNAVAPGRIQTDMLLDHADESELKRWQADTPIRRLGTPEEVAAAVLFLASPASTYLVGETLAVNGGLLME